MSDALPESPRQPERKRPAFPSMQLLFWWVLISSLLFALPVILLFVFVLSWAPE
ncbi:MAG: hypothetical protein KDB90_02545 [Planctomycetes bacterium]|nr:hypothetical protein [Planctomycetota bacterium]